MQPVVLRTAVPDDLPELQRVFEAASLSNVGDRDGLLSHPEFLVFEGSRVSAGRTRVALIDDRVVGFGTLGDASSQVLDLEHLFVDPEWQRRGIARELMTDLAETARGEGHRTLEVVGNAPALGFYLAMGFVEFDEVVTDLGSAPRLRLDLA